MRPSSAAGVGHRWCPDRLRPIEDGWKIRLSFVAELLFENQFEIMKTNYGFSHNYILVLIFKRNLRIENTLQKYHYHIIQQNIVGRCVVYKNGGRVPV